MRATASHFPPILFLLLGALVLLTCWPVLSVRPFDGTNLYILWWADSARAGDLLRVDPAVYPEWRPLPYATIWLQYRWATIDRLWAYSIVNLALWTTCGWLTHRIVQAISNSTAAGLAAAIVVLTSTQLVGSLVLIMERQTLLASLFGLLAWLSIVRVGARPARRSEVVWLSLLLLASATSKEYGLSFAAATAAYGLIERRRDVLASGLAAAAGYAVMRLMFAGGAVTPFCDDQGYFFGRREVCFDQFDAEAISQAAYNVAATGLASLLPGLFFDDGAISVSPRWLAISALLLGLAVAGWRSGPRVTRIGLLVIVFNTMLNFGVYRSRNHLPALCAVAIAAGVGLPIADGMLRRLMPSRVWRTAAVALLAALLSTRTVIMRQLMADRVAMSEFPDACGPDIPDLDRAFMRRVWEQYGLILPDCP